jgi:succinate dehydrogenase membrane anchor subunit
MIRSMRVRPSGNFEVMAWFFMRISGLLLIFLALFHFYWLHFVISVEQITFNTIVGRWTGDQGTFWRLYDLFLLSFAFTHGVNGARQVMEDYIVGRVGRGVFMTILWAIWAVLIGMGAWIIFTFRPGMPSPFG